MNSTEPNTLILVNPSHPIPDDWENRITFAEIKTPNGMRKIEVNTLKAFRTLQEALLKERIILGASEACRSVSDQEAIVQELINEKGLDWALRHAAKPGYSEHHTGMAIDVWLDFIPEDQPRAGEFPDGYLYGKLHKHLPECGFILRYLSGKEAITGYDAENWHIRYTGLPHSVIMHEKHLTLEEYLDELH